MFWNRPSRSVLLLTVFALVIPWGSLVWAAESRPVAIRRWGDGAISVETSWNLNLSLHIQAPTGERKPTQPAPDIELFRDGKVKGGLLNRPVQMMDESMAYVLDRWPNENEVRWEPESRLAKPVSIHAVRITGVSSSDKDQLLLAQVDELRIVFSSNGTYADLTSQQLQQLGRVDVLVLSVGTDESAAHLVNLLQPRFCVPLEGTDLDAKSLDGFVRALGDRVEVVKPVGNTLAVSHLGPGLGGSLRVVILGSEPWDMTEELRALFAKKEAACEASQAVFAKLSTAQMNFKPSNGTHTPRWNAEHLMGRELLYFSQIYTELEPEIRPVDLNPKQMPPDYVAAHPDWDGREEARQMQRVSAFTRRFSYLLNGVNLDELAPGGSRTPRRLFNVLENHYTEHTANVVKKFDLPDWPKK